MPTICGIHHTMEYDPFTKSNETLTSKVPEETQFMLIKLLLVLFITLEPGVE